VLTSKDEKTRKYFAEHLLEDYPTIGEGKNISESLSMLTRNLANTVSKVGTDLAREAVEQEILQS